MIKWLKGILYHQHMTELLAIKVDTLTVRHPVDIWPIMWRFQDSQPSPRVVIMPGFKAWL